MIHGIGIDIVAVRRLQGLWERHGERALGKLLAPQELAEFAQAAAKGRFLAKRFAAKEAFSKAVNTGIRNPVTLGNIGVIHDELGKPEFWVAEPLQAWMDERGIKHVHLSLTDEGHYSVAFVVAEQ